MVHSPQKTINGLVDCACLLLNHLMFAYTKVEGTFSFFTLGPNAFGFDALAVGCKNAQQIFLVIFCLLLILSLG